MSKQSVERFDVLLTPPGIDIGGNYNRPTANIVLDVKDGAIMLVGDDGHRRGPFKAGHIQGQVESGAMLNAGTADRELKGYFKAIDRERDKPITPHTVRRRADRLESLIRKGLSPAEALDYWAVEERGHTQSGWAEMREIGQGSVSENIAKAKAKLDG